MNFQIGDIVSCRGHRWVVSQHDYNHVGARNRVYLVREEWRQFKRRHSITVSHNECQLVIRPSFTPGQRVAYLNDLGPVAATVIEDRAATTLIAVDDQRQDLPGGGFFIRKNGAADAFRPDLVIRNFQKELEQ